jgi:hypothetical protein
VRDCKQIDLQKNFFPIQTLGHNIGVGKPEPESLGSIVKGIGGHLHDPIILTTVCPCEVSVGLEIASSEVGGSGSMAW